MVVGAAIMRNGGVACVNEAAVVCDAVFEGSIQISSGSLRPRVTQWETEALVQGFKLIVIGRGELQCRMPQADHVRISGPCVCAVWDQQQSESMQRFEPGCQLDYSAIALSKAAIESRVAGIFQQQLADHFQPSPHHGPGLLVMEAPPALQALRRQIASCPLQGATRELWLAGKALEMVAYAVDAIIPQRTASASSEARLTSADVEKLQQAKQILYARMQQPPSLAELALSVGINSRKLNGGFRRLFGESVFAYLQTVRLETAWELLSVGEMSVSSVAYRVGYTPAHLSVAFSKRFGVSPKALRG